MQNQCDYCHAQINGGTEACQKLFIEIITGQYTYLHYAKVGLFVVDAHVLQHPELHGKKNNAYHLMSLCWMLEHNGKPVMGSTPRWLGQFFDRDISFPHLNPPKKRGIITILDLNASPTPEKYQQKAKEWAMSVWQAWEVHHDWVRKTLVEIMKNKKYKRNRVSNNN